MPIIQIEAQLSASELLKAVAQLSPAELDRFADQVLELRAKRRAPVLSPDETALLVQINQGLPVDIQRRYDALVARRQAGQLSPDEYAELLQLTDQVEQVQAQRIEHLAHLARLRGVPLARLLDDLGIGPAGREGVGGTTCWRDIVVVGATISAGAMMRRSSLAWIR